MPEDVTVTVYGIRELGEKAQERAIEKFRDYAMEDNYWAEHVIEEFVQDLFKMGFEIDSRTYRTIGGGSGREPEVYWSGFASQGDGASFEATVDVKAFLLHHMLSDKYPLVYDAALGNNYGSAYAKVEQGKINHHYVHSNTMTVEWEVDAEYEDDEKYKELILEGYKVKEEILEKAKELAEKLYENLYEEFEYQNSDEQIIESLEANEVKFYANGTPF